MKKLSNNINGIGPIIREFKESQIISLGTIFCSLFFLGLFWYLKIIFCVVASILAFGYGFWLHFNRVTIIVLAERGIWTSQTGELPFEKFRLGKIKKTVLQPTSSSIPEFVFKLTLHVKSGSRSHYNEVIDVSSIGDNDYVAILIKEQQKKYLQSKGLKL
jgi:hypothetical protein